MGKLPVRYFHLVPGGPLSDAGITAPYKAVVVVDTPGVEKAWQAAVSTWLLTLLCYLRRIGRFSSSIPVRSRSNCCGSLVVANSHLAEYLGGGDVLPGEKVNEQSLNV